MKNIKVLVGEQEIFDFTRTLWRTAPVIESHDDPNGYIHGIVKKFAAVPRFYYEMTDPRLETSHFSTWWNAISFRPWYNNPGISDLYNHHEMFHAVDLDERGYDPLLVWNRWFSKMIQNEFSASLESEVMIYLHLPRLRPLGFTIDIWADRFLKDDGILRPFRSNDPMSKAQQAARREHLWNERKRAMMTPDPFDYIERQIADYSYANMEWARIWSETYHEVEGHMQEFYQIAATDRQKATEMHYHWLIRQTATDLALNVPFREQAQKFAMYYWNNKDTFGNGRMERSVERIQQAKSK